LSRHGVSSASARGQRRSEQPGQQPASLGERFACRAPVSLVPRVRVPGRGDALLWAHADGHWAHVAAGHAQLASWQHALEQSVRLC